MGPDLCMNLGGGSMEEGRKRWGPEAARVGPNSCPGGPKCPDLADGIQGQRWVTALMTPFLVTEVGHLAHRRQQSYTNVRVGP